MKYIFLALLFFSFSVSAQYYDSYSKQRKAYSNAEFDRDMSELNRQEDLRMLEQKVLREHRLEMQRLQNIEYEQSVQRRKRIYGY